MKNIAFLVSSAGDTDLAISTVQAIRKKSQEHSLTLIALTPIAQERIDTQVNLGLSVQQTNLAKMLELNEYPKELCSDEQLTTITQYLQAQDSIYIGIPSVNSDIPFQIAKSADKPVLMAYEYMYHEPTHRLWNHIDELGLKSNVHWGIPLSTAGEDFSAVKDPARLHVTGHLAIDRALVANQENANIATHNDASLALRKRLQVEPEQSLFFLSSTTRPAEVDADFLNSLLTELVNHPHVQLRLGLHPGIVDLDNYLENILSIYQKHPNAIAQFKIILPDNFVKKVMKPELSINNPQFDPLFIRENISGNMAASLADGVTQAVPGALVNEALLKGQGVYSTGRSYLPEKLFAKNPHGLFSATRQSPPDSASLMLDENTASERYADLLLGA